MRLKYQLRGLGIGIIITASLLMGFSDDGEAVAKADDAIVMASTECESTEEVTVAEIETQETVPIILREENTEETELVSAAEESSMETELESEMNTVDEITEVETTEVETTRTEVIETEESETETMESTVQTIGNADVVEIRIVSGDDSGTVARKLQVAGLVENASEYDAYLMQHGYDKKISVGTVEIAKGSTWLEIAEKISGRN